MTLKWYESEKSRKPELCKNEKKLIFLNEHRNFIFFKIEDKK